VVVVVFVVTVVWFTITEGTITCLSLVELEVVVVVVVV